LTHSVLLSCLPGEGRTLQNQDCRPTCHQCLLRQDIPNSIMGSPLQHQRPLLVAARAGAQCRLLDMHHFHKVLVPVSQRHPTILHPVRPPQPHFLIKKVHKHHRPPLPIFQAHRSGLQFSREGGCNFEGHLQHQKVRTALKLPLKPRGAALSIPAVQAAQGRRRPQTPSKSLQ
jgi:hypothetical protein